MFLSIVIPAYNEGKVIKKSIDLINRYFINKFSFEIIVKFLGNEIKYPTASRMFSWDNLG